MIPSNTRFAASCRSVVVAKTMCMVSSPAHPWLARARCGTTRPRGGSCSSPISGTQHSQKPSAKRFELRSGGRHTFIAKDTSWASFVGLFL